MKIVFLPHAKLRMQERGLKVREVRLAIIQPDRVEFDRTNHHRLLAKKVHHDPKTGARLLIMIIYEVSVETVEVVTVISTSKISKYL